MLGETEKRLVAEVLEGTVLTHGPRCAEFEARFAKRVGAKHAVTVSSCTAGLQLSLMAIGIMIIFILIREPRGLARLWQLGKQKLRIWPFPY